MQEIEMIIFDLDGTLWDTLDITVETINEVLEKNNLDIRVNKTIVQNGMGSSSQEVAQMYMPTLDEEKRMNLLRDMDELRRKRIENISNDKKNRIVLYMNLENVLKELHKKYKLAIVSNCGANYIETFLEYSSLEKYFDDFLAASKYGISKGKAIQTVMERNNIQRAIYIGDTQKDFNASKEANIPFIYASYGFGNIDNPEHSISNLLDLKKLMEK